MKKRKYSIYNTIGDMICDAAELIPPPERMSVSQSATRFRKLNNPGNYTGPWDNLKVPYMMEPMNESVSRELTNVVFVGPAQCAKTEALLLNNLTYNVMVDPMDFAFFFPTQAAARDFSTRRIDRLHRDSPEVGEQLIKKRDKDNKTDKHYKSGIICSLSYPSPTEIAGRPIGRCYLTDYDRMPDEVGDDGSMFDAVTKRNATFGSFGMTVAESSPSRPMSDLRWIAATPHEAPPCEGGIMSLYNRGDRRRWYWPCPRCEEFFEGEWEMLKWDTSLDDPADQAASVWMECPHCAGKILPHERDEMNTWGYWVKEGQRIVNGRVVGRGIRSKIASFWLKGPAAGLSKWSTLVNKYIDAHGEFLRTGVQTALQTFFNVDIGVPYRPIGLQMERTPEDLKSRAERMPVRRDASALELVIQRARDAGDQAPLLRPLVPSGVRFLVATVDVQTNMFVVQVHGISPGAPFDVVVVDRFDIRKSKRLDEQGDRYMVKPSTYEEDWDLIRDEVMLRTYEVDDESGRHMMIKLTACDSGGEEGATEKAYAFWRRMRNEGYSARFHLLKGDGTPSAPRAEITYPDSKDKTRLHAARGDVPVLRFNSNALKDALNGRLDSVEPGKGMVRTPDWLPMWWYKELCAERREVKGWTRLTKRNEAWDLLYYTIGVCVSKLLMVEHFDWENPLGWFAPWDVNDLVSKQGTHHFVPQTNTVDFAALGKALA